MRIRFSTGFTLLELLVAICLLAILISLSVPGLRRTYRSASEAKRGSQLRTHAQVLALYCGDQKDSFPYPFDPEAPSNQVRVAGALVSVKFFDMYWCWNSVLGPVYYPGGERDPAFTPPGSSRSTISQYYWYSANLISRPEFWLAELRTGPGQWQSVRLGDVAYPSSKGCVTNAGECLLSGRSGTDTTMAMVDGSVSERNASYGAAYPTGEGEWAGSSLQLGFVGIHTLNGVRGRDVNAR